MGELYELYDNGVLIQNYDTRILSDEKENVKGDIDAMRLYIMNNFPLTINGVDFDIDDKAQSNIQATVTSINSGLTLPANFVWRTFDNTYEPVTNTSMIIIGQLAMNYVFQMYSAAWMKKDSLDSITTLGDLDATRDSLINSNWPSNIITTEALSFAEPLATI